MTETTKARTGNPAASSFETPKHETPNYGSMPAAFHEIADKGIAQTRDTFKSAKAATEQAANLFQHAFTAAAKGATDYNLKVIEIACTNANATFDYAYELLGVKSLSDFVELSGGRARKQFETVTAQTKELATLAQKVAEPLKAGIAGAFNKVA